MIVGIAICNDARAPQSQIVLAQGHVEKYWPIDARSCFNGAPFVGTKLVLK
jgi:hypothetical protein